MCLIIRIIEVILFRIIEGALYLSIFLMFLIFWVLSLVMSVQCDNPWFTSERLEWRGQPAADKIWETEEKVMIGHHSKRVCVSVSSGSILVCVPCLCLPCFLAFMYTKSKSKHVNFKTFI